MVTYSLYSVAKSGIIITIIMECSRYVRINDDDSFEICENIWTKI